MRKKAIFGIGTVQSSEPRVNNFTFTEGLELHQEVLAPELSFGAATEDASIQERCAALEARCALLEAKTAEHDDKLQYVRVIIHVDTKTGQRIPGFIIWGARMGVNSDFWCRRDAGEGATFSVGNDFDRRTMFLEQEKQVGGGDHICLQVGALAAGPDRNIGLVSIGSNGVAESVGVLAMPYLTVSQDGARKVNYRVEGIQLFSDAWSYVVGRVGGVVNTLRK